jgi:hypothetical protein
MGRRSPRCSSRWTPVSARPRASGACAADARAAGSASSVSGLAGRLRSRCGQSLPPGMPKLSVGMASCASWLIAIAVVVKCPFARVKVPDGLPARPSLCGVCSRHWGDCPAAVKRRDQEHYEQWQHDAELLREGHRPELARRDESIAELQATIGELRGELDERPVRVVRENLDQETVDRANDERQRVCGSRFRLPANCSIPRCAS